MELTKDLYQKLVDKNKKAQIYFYKYCFNVLMRIAIRYKKNKDDAAVLVNESYLKILQNIEKYDIKKPLEPWLKRITINTAIDDFRKNKSYKETFHQIDTSIQDYKLKSETGLESKMELKEMIEKINRLLPKATKLVFNLNIIDGYSHKEISDKLNISVDTSKWHLKNARKILRINKEILIG